MKRLLVGLSSLAAFVAAAYSFYYFDIRSTNYWQAPNPWLAIGLPVGLLVVAVVLLAWVLCDNFYNIQAGTVIGHDFTPAHETDPIYVPGTPATPTSAGMPAYYIPGHWVEDAWSLWLQNERGRKGWVGVSKEIFDRYSVDSYYPGADRLGEGGQNS